MSLDVDFQPEQTPGKFEHPDWTATRERRASVALERLETLWINTGTLCNITCRNCYIESSPTNDRLAYITRAEAVAYYDEIAAQRLGTREIGFTGGEPFMNPQMLGLIEDALARGFEVLVLTNAMQPMQRPRIRSGLFELNQRFGARLTLRVSLDHHGKCLARSRARATHLGEGPRRAGLARIATASRSPSPAGRAGGKARRKRALATAG